MWPETAMDTLKSDTPNLIMGPDVSPEPTILPESKLQEQIQHKSRGGIISRMIGAVREWSQLQKLVKAHSATVAKNDWDVQEGIHSYRLALSEVAFKPVKIDQEIWESYENLQQEVPGLVRKTRRSPLFLRGRKDLRSLEKSWSSLLVEQSNLLETLSKAPKSTEFYNRIHLARIKKRDQELRDAEVARRNALAKEAIEKAMADLNIQAQNDSSIAGSSILKLDDAHRYWQERMQEISNLESSARMDPDEVVSVFRNLEQTIREAPSMVGQVKEVEVRFIRLMSMQDELSAYGKNVIPAEELSPILLKVQDEIPRFWVTGEWDKLRRALNDVASFVKYYESSVRSELSLVERRKPGLTKAMLMGANHLPLSQATPVIRSLVSAIDARDRYMRGHSDYVAKLVLQLGKRMNWTGEDLDMLEMAALLHDVGKLVIPENVLTKQDPLTPDEWKTIQMHPYHGARIVKSIEALSKTVPWIYHHQERWDGAGYPDGLSKTSIPAAARIISLGEAFTVMVTDQPKRKAFTLDQALDEVQRGSGTQFDPEVAEALKDIINSGTVTMKPPRTTTSQLPTQ